MILSLLNQNAVLNFHFVFHISTGTAIGTVLSLLFTGLIVQYINWEAVFYIMGGLSSIWCVLWWFLMTDSPRTNPYISDEERDYIVSSLGEDKEEVTQKVNTIFFFQA
jgi:ACS family sodium-dependent inorganic phosphate cotransporter